VRKLVFCLFVALGLFSVFSTYATIFGKIQGIVHDPQHRPISGIKIVLADKTSSYSVETLTDAEGQFHFDAVPLGEYSVSVVDPAFVPESHAVTVLSGSAPVLHFELHLASQNESVPVWATSATGLRWWRDGSRHGRGASA